MELDSVVGEVEAGCAVELIPDNSVMEGVKMFFVSLGEKIAMLYQKMLWFH